MTINTLQIFKELAYFQMGSEVRTWCDAYKRTEQSHFPCISCLQQTRTSLNNAQCMSLSEVRILSLQYTQPWPTLETVSGSADT